MVRRRRISKIRFGGKNISGEIRERKIARIFRGPVFRDDSGAEIAEAAFVLPLVLVLIFGIMWFGRAFNIYSTLNRAAQEAAQAGAMQTPATLGNTLPTQSDITTNVINPILIAAHLDPSSANVSEFSQNAVLSAGPPTELGTIVTITYPYNLKLNGITCCPLTLTPITSGLTITAHAQALQEN